MQLGKRLEILKQETYMITLYISTFTYINYWQSLENIAEFHSKVEKKFSKIGIYSYRNN